MTAEPENKTTDTQLSLLDRLSGPLAVPVSGTRQLLAHAFFALDNRANQERISLVDGAVKIEVVAGRDLGVPTMYDADLLFYVLTRVVNAIDHGVDPEHARMQEFSVRDFLRATGRVTTGEAYAAFDQSLERLLAARIKTNIETVDDDETMGVDGSFTWFDSQTLVSYHKSPNGHRRRARVRISLGKWLLGHLVNNRNAFRLHQDYFELSSGVERRLYNIARVHVGRQDQFVILLPNLLPKVGTALSLAKFGKLMRDIAERDPLPEYSISVFEPGDLKQRRTKSILDRTKVVFKPKAMPSRNKSSSADTSSWNPSPSSKVIPLRHSALSRRLSNLDHNNRMTLAGNALRRYVDMHDGQRHPMSKGELASNLRDLCQLLIDVGLEDPE